MNAQVAAIAQSLVKGALGEALHALGLYFRPWKAIAELRDEWNRLQGSAKHQQPGDIGQIENRAGAGQKVLIVEDDPRVRKLMVAMCEHLGFAVAVTSPDADHFPPTPFEPPDVVILDVGQPERGWRKTYRSLKSAHPELPWIFFHNSPGVDLPIADSELSDVVLNGLPSEDRLVQAIQDAILKQGHQG